MDAYGFCSADSGPQKYYFEINLFDEIDVDVQVKYFANVYYLQQFFALISLHHIFFYLSCIVG